MKGKARLTLCDAQSGRVISRTEESNMVTNALRALFDPPRQAMFGGWNMADMLKGYLPMYKNLLGGIMLLGNNITEDAESVMLPAGIKPVGYAGDAYSGANTMRGSLNLNETYATENGWHFTWDFATDKANGTIRCIALTNRLFGNSGFNCGGSGGILFSPNDPSSAASAPNYTLHPAQSGYIAGCFSKERCTRVLIDGSTITLRTVIQPSAEALRILDDPTSPGYEDKSFELPFVPDPNGRFFVDGEQGRIFFFSLANPDDEHTVVSWCGVKISDTNDRTSGSATLPYLGYTSLNAALYNGQLYIMTQSSTSVYTEEGTLLRSYDAALTHGSRFFVLNGAVLSVVYKNNTYCYQDFSCEGEVLYSGSNMRLCPAVPIKPPYVLAEYINSVSNTAPGVMCMTNYMATINNLSAPITKTPSQTLKIEYDITN